MRTAPAPAVLELDDISWRDARTQDGGILEHLAATGTNRLVFQLPAFTHDFMLEPSKPGFRQTMVCHRAGVPFGAGAYSMRSLQNLNVKLICFFAEPQAAATALAMYVRHLFWGLPLHRIHAQLPLVEGGPGYVELLRAAGFQAEGVVQGHAVVNGHPYDLAVLGVLRPDFDTWCELNEPRLCL